MHVSATDKEYNISNAVFTAELQENGDAIITEYWTVNYTKGDFTKFYKDIYTNLPILEQFDDIEVMSCLINGTDAIATNNTTERKENTYYFEKNSDTDTIHWFKPASNETIIHYEIKYKLTNVVKQVDNNALFCYRFIGANF